MTPIVDPGPETGERIGAYRVVRRLATGGTSDVLLAKAEGPHGFERTVVLKVLLSHFGKDDEVSRMFAREASAYARLSHPSIVRLFDFFAVPAEGKDAARTEKGGQLVMALEYVDGPPLARLKSMVKAIGKELDDKASIYVAASIFSALAAAHSATDDSQIPAPVIHRDVNPSNVLVPWDGYPKLADFGVAKVTGLGHASVVGMIKGTYGYMAPEQVTGQEAVTPRSDVYAAAIILWELLTRRRAFQRGALPEIEALRAMAEPRLPALESIRSDVDRSVRDALRRALEPRPEKRKITAEEMASILMNVVSLETGRERLMSLLGLVRNDSRAATAQASIAPPAMITPGGTATLPEIAIPGPPKPFVLSTATMSGVAPPATVQGFGLGDVLSNLQNPSRLMAKGSPPRPSSQRMLAASPATGSSAKIPAAQPGPFFPPDIPNPNIPSTAPSEPSIRELLSLPTRPAMHAVTPPPGTLGAPLAPPPQPNRIASRPALAAATLRGSEPPPPLRSEPPRGPSAAARLAGALPDDGLRNDGVPPTRQLGGMLDNLGDSFPPGPPMRLSAPPDSPRTGAPLKDLTGGLGLRDAIDEIMRGVPASASLAAAKALARPADDNTEEQEPSERTLLLRETTRVPANVSDDLIRGLTEIGHIPPAPAPMQADFPNAADDREEPPVETVVLDPPPPTPRMAHTVAMEARPMPPGSDPKLATPTSTGAMPKYAPPAFAQTTPIPAVTPPPSGQPHAGQPHAGQPHSGQAVPMRPSQNPQMQARASAPPAKRGIGAGTVAVLLVILVVAAGVTGMVAFVRLKDAPPSVPSATTPSVTIAPVVSVAAPIPTVIVEAGAEPASASVDAAAAVPILDDAGPTEPLAEGMGLVRTLGAAPGRRIFVDDKVAGQTPDSITVKCGAHSVKLGSTGKPQDVNVPCGGEILVGDPKP